MPVSIKKKYDPEFIKHYNKTAKIVELEFISAYLGTIKAKSRSQIRPSGYIRQLLVTCPKCLKERWITTHNLYKMQTFQCSHCSSSAKIRAHNKIRKIKVGQDSPLWKRGYTERPDGYRILRLSLADPFLPTADKYRRIREHRYVMAKHLGRNLYPWEIVHHVNGNPKDNRVENLELVAPVEHTLITKMQSYIKELERKIELLGEIIDASNLKKVA